MTSPGASPKFINSFKIQLRVIYALLMREIITRYGRHNLGFMWLFLEPMLFTLGVTILWYNLKATHGSDLAIVPFAITGYSTVLMWRNTANRVVNAIEANTGLLYHRNVRVIDVFLARMFLEIAGATMSILILSMFFISIGLMEFPKDILLMIEGWVLLAWFAMSLGFIVGSLAEISEVIDRIWHTITYLLFPLSGAAFMVNWIPSQMQKFVLYLPMVHATEMVRHGFYGDLIPTYENPVYLVGCNLVMSLIGLFLIRYISTKVESSH